MWLRHKTIYNSVVVTLNKCDYLKLDILSLFFCNFDILKINFSLEIVKIIESISKQ